jgi:hypothetical protein
MTTWRLLYENRFPRNADTGATILDVRRAADGVQTVQSGPVFIIFSGFHGLGMGEGRNLTYRPVSALADVIGVDVTMEIGIIALFEARPLTLFSTGGGGMSAVLTATGPPSPSGHTTCRLTLRVASAVATVDGVRFRHRFGTQQLEPRRLQVRWTTNGQLHVWLDGLLIAYENAFAPGHRFTLGQLAIGDVDLTMTGVVNAAISGVRIVELREESGVDSLAGQLDPEYVPPIPDRCVKVARATLEQILRDTRALMAAFTASRTSPWRKPVGGNPFTPAALGAHEAGAKAGVAFARYLRSGSPEARQAVLSHLKDLLETLAADQPALFQALMSKSRDARAALDTHCKEAAYAIRSSNPRLFAKLDPLSADLEDLIQSLGGRR